MAKLRSTTVWKTIREFRDFRLEYEKNEKTKFTNLFTKIEGYLLKLVNFKIEDIVDKEKN